MSIELLKKALPDKFKRSLNDEVLENINHVLNHPEYHEVYRDTFLSYTSVLNDGKYKLGDYLNAVKYCSHKLMGCNNTEAYMKTFPDRYQEMLIKGIPAKDITSLITVYNKSKLVNAIMEQSAIPTWVLNQDLYQEAINVQADLMRNAQSEKVRSDSANSLLIHLKPPETKKVELDIGLKENKDIENMRNTLAELASMQQRMIQSGVLSANEVAQSKLIGQVIEHDEQ